MAGRGTNSIEAFNKQALRDIRNALNNLPKEFTLEKRRNILKKGASSFIDRAKSKAPIDTGELREAIGTKTFRNNKEFVFAGVRTKGKVSGVLGKVEIDGFYAKFLEYGFEHLAWPKKGERLDKSPIRESRITKVKAKPFLRPAWDESKNQMRKDVENLTEKKIKAYERKNKIK